MRNEGAEETVSYKKEMESRRTPEGYSARECPRADMMAEGGRRKMSAARRAPMAGFAVPVVPTGVPTEIAAPRMAPAETAGMSSTTTVLRLGRHNHHQHEA